MKVFKRLILIITAGIIVAMSGVGDLATVSLVGSRLGSGVLWADWWRRRNINSYLLWLLD